MGIPPVSEAVYEAFLYDKGGIAGLGAFAEKHKFILGKVREMMGGHLCSGSNPGDACWYTVAMVLKIIDSQMEVNALEG